MAPRPISRRGWGLIGMFLLASACWAAIFRALGFVWSLVS